MIQLQSAHLQNAPSSFTSLHALADLSATCLTDSNPLQHHHHHVPTIRESILKGSCACAHSSTCKPQCIMTMTFARKNPQEFGEENCMISLCEGLKIKRVSVALFLSKHRSVCRSVCRFLAFFSTSRCLSLSISHADY